MQIPLFKLKLGRDRAWRNEQEQKQKRKARRERKGLGGLVRTKSR